MKNYYHTKDLSESEFLYASQKKLEAVDFRIDDIPRTTARGLHRTAEEFLHGYKIISKEYPDLTAFCPNLGLYKVRYYLLGHALELAFKSFLFNHGVELDHLKHDIAHNLAQCLSLAKQKGLNIFDEQEETAINMLNAFYSKKMFEYPEIGSKILLPLNNLEKIAGKIIIALNKELCGYLKGAEPPGQNSAMRNLFY